MTESMFAIRVDAWASWSWFITAVLRTAQNVGKRTEKSKKLLNVPNRNVRCPFNSANNGTYKVAYITQKRQNTALHVVYLVWYICVSILYAL